METTIYVYTESGIKVGEADIDLSFEDANEIIEGHVDEGNIVIFGDDISELIFEY